MDEKGTFLKFWEQESPATRKVISRIPEDRSDYRADPKARKAREIGWLFGTVAGVAAGWMLARAPFYLPSTDVATPAVALMFFALTGVVGLSCRPHVRSARSRFRRCATSNTKLISRSTSTSDNGAALRRPFFLFP